MAIGLELVSLFLEIAPPAVKAIMKLIPKKGRRDSDSKRKIVSSILAEIKHLIEGVKPVAGTSTTRPGDGHLEDLKQLREKVEEGDQLVHKKKIQQKDLKDWIVSSVASLLIARLRVQMRIASTVEQIRGQLMYNQSPQTHIPLHISNFMCCPGVKSVRTSKAICCPRVKSVRISKAKVACCQARKQSVDNRKAMVDCCQARKQSVENPTKKVVSEVVARDDCGKKIVEKATCPVKGDEAKVAGSPASKQSVDNSREPVQKKVIFEVLARSDYGKKIVEKAACHVKGVVHAERVVQDNQERDLVIVIAKEIFVAKDMIEYLKKNLRRIHVYVKEK